MVRLYVRDANGQLTPDMSLLKQTVEYIREICDIVIEISTGGVSNLTIEERCQPCYAPYVEAVLKHMVSYLRECFPEEKDVLWGYTQANRRDWEMMKTALDMGASSVRIGFEDSDYIAKDVRVKNNYELIAKVSDILKEKNLQPMTPEEVRKMLHIGV